MATLWKHCEKEYLLEGEELKNKMRQIDAQAKEKNVVVGGDDERCWGHGQAEWRCRRLASKWACSMSGGAFYAVRRLLCGVIVTAHSSLWRVSPRRLARDMSMSILRSLRRCHIGGDVDLSQCDRHSTLTPLDALLSTCPWLYHLLRRASPPPCPPTTKWLSLQPTTLCFRGKCSRKTFASTKKNSFRNYVALHFSHQMTDSVKNTEIIIISGTEMHSLGPRTHWLDDLEAIPTMFRSIKPTVCTTFDSQC